MKEAVEALMQVEYERRVFLTLNFGRTYDKQMENELHFLRDLPRKKYQTLVDECNRLKNLITQLA